MEKKNKNIIMVVLVMLVFCLSGYLFYDKVLSDNKCIVDDNKVEDVFDDNSDDNVNNDNKDSVDNTENNSIELEEDMEVVNTKIEKYKNYDDSYGNVKSLTYEDNYNENAKYNINLDINGTVIYKYINGSNVNEIVLIRNAVDIISFSDGAGSIDVICVYILNKEGNVYRFKLTDSLEEETWPVKKIDVSNVERLLSVSWNGRENAGGNWAIVAITKSGEYVELNNASV